MNDLQAQKVTIGKLLSQEYFFRVPEYQRAFSWEVDNFEDLIGDIITANKTQEYFLGTIVLHATEIAGNYNVVDGQQRLTSLMILLACLRDLVAAAPFKSGIQTKIQQPENVVDGIPDKVRLEVKDRVIFAALVIKNGGTIDPPRSNTLSEPESRYVQAIEIYKDRLSSLKQPELEAVITFLNQKCVVISLTTSTFNDAFRLFTIVNDRGKQLRRIDILKALNIAPEVIVKDTVRNRIAQQWEDYEKELGESTFENIFHLIRLIQLKDKPQGDLLSEFTDRIFSKGSLSRGEAFVNVVFDYAKLYRNVFLDRDILDETDKPNIVYKGLIFIMDSEFRASFAKKFSGAAFLDFCLKIEKVYLEQWMSGIRKDERYASYAKILGFIESAKKPADVIDSITFDKDSILKAVANKNLYKASYCRYVLLRLELLASEHDVEKDFIAKSIEHVLPQNPEAKGYWADNHDLAAIGDYVNTVGNLVLLSKSKNSASSNFDFAKKKEKYLKSRVTDYPRSVEVLNYDKWDRPTIEKRNSGAQEIFLNNP